MTRADVSTSSQPRSLSWVGLIVLLVVFALLPAFVDVLVLGGSGEFTFPDQASATNLVLTKTVALAVAVAAVTYLRWWTVVLHEQLRTRPWLWVMPAVIITASLALADWGRVGEAGVLLASTVLLGALLIAVGEELVFRGVVLTFLRQRYREAVAAGVTAVLFGLIHVTAGPLQVVVSTLFGLLLYYCRRVSGGLVVPILVHTAWDVSVFTAFLTDTPSTDSGAGLVLTLLTVALLLLVAVFHRRVDRPTPGQAGK